MHFLSLAFAILIGVAGQIFLKLGAVNMNSKITIAAAEGTKANLWEQIFDFNLWLGLFFYGISTLFYIFSLQKIPLSIAYPTVSLGYIFVLLLSNFIFKETIATQQILGVALITIGVFFLWKH